MGSVESWVALITCVIAVGGVCLGIVKMIIKPLETTASTLTDLYKKVDEKVDDHEHRITVVETKIGK